jgi:tetratricopeptide (TPR) repeat protein
VFGTRLAWSQSVNPWVVLSEVVFPAGVFVAAFTAAAWAGGDLGAAGLCGRAARIALAAGLGGFLLHNLVTYTLFSPAASTVFWVAAAAAVAPGARVRELRRAKAISAAVAALLIAAVAAAGIWLWWPVQRNDSYVRSAQLAFSTGRPQRAIAQLEAAIDADPLDGLAPGYLARIYLAALQQGPPEPIGQAMAAEAVHFATLAYERCPRSSHAILLAEALELGRRRRKAVEMAAKAVQLDPMNGRLRWQYAGMLFRAGSAGAAREQVREVRRLDDALLPESDMRLSAAERAALAELEEAIEAAARTRPSSAQAAVTTRKPIDEIGP